jgi:hypothetical protein
VNPSDAQVVIPSQIDDPEPSEMHALEGRLRAGERLCVQFSTARYTKAQLGALESLCNAHGANLEVRFYGHPQASFDGKTLLGIPSVANLSISCMQNARNLETIAELASLQHLCLGVFELDDDRFLRLPNLRQLRSLALHDTRTNRLDLAYLADFAHVETLLVAGHTRGIAALSAMPALTSLTLNSIPKRTGLDFVSGIRSLRQLSLVLGGRNDLAQIESQQLESLEVIRVRGFTDLGDLARFPALESLLIDDQFRVQRIELSAGNAALERIRILNCKTLKRISGLELLSRLRELRIWGTALEPDAFIAQAMPRTLEVFALYTSKERENRRIRAALDALGYREF